MAIKGKIVNIRFTLTNEALGTRPASRTLFLEHMAHNAPDVETAEEEAMGLPEIDEKGKTVYARDEYGNKCWYDFQMKGYMKDTCKMLQKMSYKDPETGKKAPVNESSKIRSYKQEIDGLIFVKPRMIPIHIPADAVDKGDYGRPLRAETPMGPRNAWANSETVPEGSYWDMQVMLLKPELENALYEWCEMAALRGFGAWRNAGFGTATYEILPDDYPVCDGSGEEV